ncbi:MAG: Spy/CpxP family protein refolding chaperone [Deltaproteobacteria bacterium]|jgi:Spy/CpxP family protein refolding chaperone|nr:Spy/CpxP family protein refolding chaperone [Deltaproteobacteria bacterium]
MHQYKRVIIIGAVLAVLTLSGASSARPPFGPPDSDRDPGAFIEENAEALELDDETLGAIRGIVAQSKAKGDQLHARLRESREQLKALLDQGAPDESAVMKQIETIGAVEIEMHKHRLGTMLEIRALLTPEQREQMTRLRDESRGRWRHALREACQEDLETLCPDAADRWSRKQCLRDQREQLSAACRDALEDSMRARHGLHGRGPMHHGADCPLHDAADCPMQQGGDCPMHRGADCPLRQGAGSPDPPEAGDAY